MTQTTVDEMRRLLRQMNELENRVLSLQDTISTFRSDVEYQITGACDGSTQDLPAAATRATRSRDAMPEATGV
jgi:signal transduction histidine kinase